MQSHRGRIRGASAGESSGVDERRQKFDTRKRLVDRGSSDCEVQSFPIGKKHASPDRVNAPASVAAPPDRHRVAPLPAAAAEARSVVKTAEVPQRRAVVAEQPRPVPAYRPVSACALEPGPRAMAVRSSDVRRPSSLPLWPRWPWLPQFWLRQLWPDHATSAPGASLAGRCWSSDRQFAGSSP